MVGGDFGASIAAYSVLGNATVSAAAPGFTTNPAASSFIAEGSSSGSCAYGASATGSTATICGTAITPGDLVTYHTPATGIARSTASSQAIAATELSGFVTTSGSNATTVQNNAILPQGVSLSASTGGGFVLVGSGLTAGYAYYQAAGGLTAAKADSASTLPAICIAISTTQCAFSGVWKFSGSQSWTSGNMIYVSDSGAGALVTTAPSTSGHFVQRVGVALANDTIHIMPSLDVAGIQ